MLGNMLRSQPCRDVLSSKKVRGLECASKAPQTWRCGGLRRPVRAQRQRQDICRSVCKYSDEAGEDRLDLAQGPSVKQAWRNTMSLVGPEARMASVIFCWRTLGSRWEDRVMTWYQNDCPCQVVIGSRGRRRAITAVIQFSLRLAVRITRSEQFFVSFPFRRASNRLLYFATKSKRLRRASRISQSHFAVRDDFAEHRLGNRNAFLCLLADRFVP